MAVGAVVGFEGNVPLLGESEIVQRTAATDILTITGASSQTGDFLVCRNSAGTEKFYVTSAGVAYFASTVTLNGSGTQATLAALSTVSGSFGASASAAYVLLVQKVDAIEARLKGLGLLT
jgi:hypothetical protein